MRFRILPLEERIVLDAAGTSEIINSYHLEHQTLVDKAGVGPDKAVQDNQLTANRLTDHTGANLTPATRVLVISSQVQDSSLLAEAALSNVKVVMYDPSTTSLSQLSALISNTLNGQKATSIAFASYGSEGQFALTQGQMVSINALEASSALQAFWQNVGQMVQNGGKVDLLACDVAATANGMSLVNDLDALMSSPSHVVNVDASTNRIGNSAGGNWLLDVGHVQANTLYFNTQTLQNWHGVLDTLSVTASPFVDDINTNVNLVKVGYFTDPAATGANLSQYSAQFTQGSSYITATIQQDLVNTSQFDIYVRNNQLLTFTRSLNSLNPFSLTVKNSGNGLSQTSLTSDYLESTATPAPITVETINNPFTTSLGSFLNFTDSNLADYSVNVNWGDGSSSNLTNGITLSGPVSGQFNISGTHNYINGGAFTPAITVTDVFNGLTFTLPTTTLPVSTFSDTIDVHNLNVSAIPFVNNLINNGNNPLVEVGYFTDPFATANLSQYSAQFMVNSSSITATIQQDAINANQFDVYVQNYQLSQINQSRSSLNAFSLTVKDTVDNLSQTSHSNFIDGYFNSAFLIEPAAQSFTANVGVFYIYADQNLNDFSVNVNWGDGSSSNRSSGISLSNQQIGSIVISGTHTYSTAGSYTPTITVTDLLGGINFTLPPVTLPATPFADTINVYGPIKATSLPITEYNTNVTAPSGFTAQNAYELATFTNGSPTLPLSDYAATINWGDGSAVSNGTIIADPSVSGQFDVYGSHTYAAGATGDQAIVTITNTQLANLQTTANDNVVVTHPITGQSFNTALDIHPQFTGGTSTAVTWGDGTNNSPTSSMSDNQGGTIYFFSHNYATSGTYTRTFLAMEPGLPPFYVPIFLNFTNSFSVTDLPPNNIQINGAITETTKVPLLTTSYDLGRLTATPFPGQSIASFKFADGTTTSGNFTISGDQLNVNTNGFTPATYTLQVEAIGTDGLISAPQTLTISLLSNPIAHADNYKDIYTGSSQLNITSALQGVIANDNNYTGQALTANLLTQTSNGLVALNADGTFSYTPKAGFYGTDTFTYDVSNSVGTSNVATVSILVDANPNLTLSQTSLNYVHQTAAVNLEPSGQITQSTANLNGGKLVALINSNYQTGDQLLLNAASGITFGSTNGDGSINILYNSQQIGNYADNGQTLTINFTSALATPAVATTLLDNLAFQNSNTVTGTRNVLFTLTDGLGTQNSSNLSLNIS